MEMTLQEYLDFIRTSNTRKNLVKLEFLDEIEGTLATTKSFENIVTDGSLNIDLQNGVRRTVNLTIVNENGEFIPDKNGDIWFGKYFKLYTGISDVSTEKYKYFPQGIFAFSNPQFSSNGSSQTLSLEGFDFGSLINGELNGELEYDYIIPQGSDVFDFLKQIINETQLPTKEVFIDPNLSGVTTPFDIEVSRGGTYSDVISKLAEAYVYEFYFDVNGVFRFVPPVDENSQAPIFHLGDDEINYMGNSSSYDLSKMYNAVRVYGDVVGGDVAIGYSEDKDVFSPTNVDSIPKRVFVLEDTIIQDDAKAQERADYELKKYIQLWESVDISSVPIDNINVDEIITNTDKFLKSENKRFKVTSVSLPIMKNSTMNISCWKTRNITDSIFIN